MGTYYTKTLDYIDKIDPAGSWLEIGLDRGEGSTKFFSDLASKKSVNFYGVDADHSQVERARLGLSVTGQAILEANGSLRMETQDLPAHVKLFHAKGEDFLAQFKKNNLDEKFSLVYLDNFDWDYWCNREPEPFVAGQKQHYRDYMKIEMTNMHSQMTHLVQAIRLLPLMTERSIIVCDDTWYHPDEGVFIGKCSAVIPYLLLNGYKIFNNQGYRQNSGAILGRGI